jgi:hypothetical protein
VIVLNLHPQNVSETRSMHRAALELIDSGFLAWSMRDCLDWFGRRDAVPSATSRTSRLAALFGGWKLRNA